MKKMFFIYKLKNFILKKNFATKAVLSARDKFKMLDQKNTGGIKHTAPRPVSAPAGSPANNFQTAKERLLAWAQSKTKGYPVSDCFFNRFD